MLPTTRKHRRPNTVFAGLFIALMAAPAAMAGERMPESEIARTFSGITLDGIYSTGAFFTESYNEDRSIRYHDVDGADSGEWSVQDGKFCTFYESQQGSCFFVERDGTNCFTFYEPEEPTDAEPPADGAPTTAPAPKAEAGPRKEWTSRGWDRSHPPTCPKAPEVEL
ncbi:hypothetical protein OSH11_07505 [Kaistia dalseonensis]|uniref:Uncharacterized protein n=1 Tax=Kaistia dalseonensis TaxID=410840 RepID=A0ABU0H486_9HYPH|nr:hypothetical protein [Kaistia dalseonensis]MCX5494542.1 hypothetical protein [Kaistia dalseonensis]MDQ0437122.1 hypothetical protein [Kaistia dalseonensis]